MTEDVEITSEGRHTEVSSIMLELRQFDKLRSLEPKISCAEIAHRMAWSKRDTRWLLKKMGDDRL